ncbi:hypothetical protein AX14_004319 [Amanita brunnescens Koide BX004]|nr:hypothetical protein AX14_004319 [Amanita brunnescens Koide BX004]
MRVFLACVLALTSSAMGYQVTVPNTSENWTNVGGQPLSWQRVDTDPQNFTVVLTNVNNQNQQVLAALVDGTLGNTTCNPPSGGWPLGNGFRVDFVKDASDLNTILAQSSQFSIVIPSANSSSTPSVPVITPSVTVSPATVPAVAATTAGGSSSTSTLAPAGNGALRHAHTHVGLWGGILGFLGLLLA